MSKVILAVDFFKATCSRVITCYLSTPKTYLFSIKLPDVVFLLGARSCCQIHFLRAIAPWRLKTFSLCAVLNSLKETHFSRFDFLVIRNKGIGLLEISSSLRQFALVSDWQRTWMAEQGVMSWGADPHYFSRGMCPRYKRPYSIFFGFSLWSRPSSKFCWVPVVVDKASSSCMQTTMCQINKSSVCSKKARDGRVRRKTKKFANFRTHITRTRGCSPGSKGTSLTNGYDENVFGMFFALKNS